MVEHRAYGVPLSADMLTLAQVRHRLERLVEMRLLAHLDPASQAELEALSQRETDLLNPRIVTR